MADLRYPVSLGGRSFLVSRRGGRFGRRSIPLQKAQQDTSESQGEQSLNPEDLWRRSLESWHRGAGQSSYDRAGSDPFRFDDSLGIDPWEKWELRLLPDVESKLASAASNVRLAVAGSYLYCADGSTLRYTQDITGTGAATWTTVSMTPVGQTITGITSDGFNVWIALGSAGIYKTTRGAASAFLYSVLPASCIRYVKGRLMAAYNGEVTNLTLASYEPAASFVAWSTWPGAALTNGQVAAITYPAGATANGVGVAIVTYSGTGRLTVPDDQTLLADLQEVGSTLSLAFYKRVSGAETVNLTASGAIDSWSAVTYTIQHVDEEEPFETVGVALSNVANSFIVTPDITTTRAHTLILSAFSSVNATSRTATAPTGAEGSPSTTVSTVAPYSMTGAARFSRNWQPGPTGNYTWNLSGDVSSSVGWTIGLRTFAPNRLTTHPSTDFTWVDFAEGQGDIYAAGYSGDKSTVYRTQIKADGTALDVPVVAGAVPDGEVVRSIYGYLGLLFIGSDKGLRMATNDANGDLTIGSLIEMPASVRCFEGQGQYVWFGLEDFDVSRWVAGTYDGLGRLDPTQLTNPLTPAYASDLMATAATALTEQVQSVVTFQDRQVFTVADQSGATRGVYAATTRKVATGYLDSGLITYGIADTKVATFLDVRSKPLVGTLEAYLSADAGAFPSIGTSTVAGSTRTPEPLNAGPSRGDTHEVRIRLNRASATDDVGPTLTRLTLRSEPAPSRGRIYQVPLILSRKLNVVGHEVSIDPAESLAFIEGLFDTQTLVPYREGNTTAQVFVKDYEFVAEHQTSDRHAEQGICTVTLKVPGS